MEFILDGNNFSTVEGFYLEIEKVFTKDLTWKTGHNYAAYDDLLCGGFGMHDYGEPITIKWYNYEKSKKDLGDEFIFTILEITLNCNNSNHNCKLELY